MRERPACSPIMRALSTGQRNVTGTNAPPASIVSFSKRLHEREQGGSNASPRISPSAGPRNSYTVALTSLLPFARERRFRSAAVIARSSIHCRPPLLGFVTPSIGFVTIEGFVTGFVTSSTPKSHPPQCLSPHIIDNAERPFLVPKTGRGAPTSLPLGPQFHGWEGGPISRISCSFCLPATVEESASCFTVDRNHINDLAQSASETSGETQDVVSSE